MTAELAGTDVTHTDIAVVDETGGLRRPIGVVNVSVHALKLLLIVRSAAAASDAALNPPPLRTLLERHASKVRGVPSPSVTSLASSSRKGELEPTEEDAVSSACRAEITQPTSAEIIAV